MKLLLLIICLSFQAKADGVRFVTTESAKAFEHSTYVAMPAKRRPATEPDQRLKAYVASQFKKASKPRMVAREP